MGHPRAVELSPGVVRIPTIGAASTNSFAFVDDDGSVTLVDCGLKRAPGRIVAGLRAIGRHPSDVTRILLTHAHLDHAGGAADMAARTGARSRCTRRTRRTSRQGGTRRPTARCWPAG